MSEFPQPTPGTTPVIPPLGKRTTIDFQDVRHFIFDRTAADNPMLLDLEFTDTDISYAMRFAAMNYNEMEPKVELVDSSALPFGTVFLYGIVYHLHLGELERRRRNNVEYTAGDMSVDINKRRIDSLMESMKFFHDEFLRLASDRKRTINIEGAYGHF